MTRQDRTRTRPSWEKAFLRTLAETGHVQLACRAVRISRSSVYDARATDARFAQAWEDALEERADVIEAEAWRRAMEGVEVQVFRGGRPVGTVRRRSDRILMMMMKGARPWKYSERGPAIEARVLANVERAVDAALRQLHVEPAVASEFRRHWRTEYTRMRG